MSLLGHEPPPFGFATGPRGFPGPPVMEPIKAPLLVNVMDADSKGNAAFWKDETHMEKQRAAREPPHETV